MTGKKILLTLAMAAFVLNLHVGGGGDTDNSTTPIFRTANAVSLAATQPRQQHNYVAHELRFRDEWLYQPESACKFSTGYITSITNDHNRQAWRKAQWGWD